MFNAGCIPVVYLFFPETAGRTLEDLDLYFREKHQVFVHRDKVFEIAIESSEALDALSCLPLTRWVRTGRHHLLTADAVHRTRERIA